MKVSLNWIKDFVKVEASHEEVAERLTMAGLEIEGTEMVEGDVVLEVNVTPNRPDCLSILGIAREVAAAFGLPLVLPDTFIEAGARPSYVGVEILKPGLCNRYTGRVISGVSVVDTPDWIKNRLEKCGIRPLNNNIVDITNYVLLEFGHPLHAFDADRLSGRTIRVDTAGDGSSIVTLDGMKRELPPEALLIWDVEVPVAVAGVMGGEATGVTVQTKNIFLESAYFEPTSVRRTSKALGLKSEASYRFERGTDIEFLLNALDRAALLIRESGGGTIHGVVDAYPEPYAATALSIRYDRVNALLGTSLGKDEMHRVLGLIGLKPQDRGDFIEVTPPSFRRDISAPVDIVEEVARIYNFGNIPVRIPRTALSSGVLNRRETAVSRMRESIRKSGFSEVINYSFMNPSDLDLLSIGKDDARRRSVCVMNPLRQEDSLMRTTLVPSLVNNFIYNLSRGSRDIRLFEISRIFVDQGGQLPNEELRVAGILFRDDVPSLWREDCPSFYLVKGALQSLFEEMKVRDTGYIPSSEIFLHRGKSAEILINDKSVGFMGELDPGVVEKMNLKVQRPSVIVFELNAEKIMEAVPDKTTYSPIPRFPSIERDVALLIDDEIPSSRLMSDIRTFKSGFIEKVELFDCFKGKGIPEGKKSLAFRIVYRLSDRTMTDDEVETIHKELLVHVLGKTGGELRG